MLLRDRQTLRLQTTILVDYEDIKASCFAGARISLPSASALQRAACLARVPAAATQPAPGSDVHEFRAVRSSRRWRARCSACDKCRSPHARQPVCCGSSSQAALCLRVDHEFCSSLSRHSLVGGAFKFTTRQPYARVQFGCTEHAAQAAIFVRDNGVGFDINHADKLFLPFARLHSESEFSGTGIGLATVQRIIARHRGRVWAQGTIGDGATFYFTLAPDDAPRASARSGPSGTDCARDDTQPLSAAGSSTAPQSNQLPAQPSQPQDRR